MHLNFSHLAQVGFSHTYETWNWGTGSFLSQGRTRITTELRADSNPFLQRANKRFEDTGFKRALWRPTKRMHGSFPSQTWRRSPSAEKGLMSLKNDLYLVTIINTKEKTAGEWGRGFIGELRILPESYVRIKHGTLFNSFLSEALREAIESSLVTGPKLNNSQNRPGSKAILSLQA